MTWPWDRHARAPTGGAPASRLASGTPGNPQKLCRGGRTYSNFPDEPPAKPRRTVLVQAPDGYAIVGAEIGLDELKTSLPVPPYHFSCWVFFPASGLTRKADQRVWRSGSIAVSPSPGFLNSIDPYPGRVKPSTKSPPFIWPKWYRTSPCQRRIHLLELPTSLASYSYSSSVDKYGRPPILLKDTDGHSVYPQTKNSAAGLKP